MAFKNSGKELSSDKTPAHYKRFGTTCHDAMLKIYGPEFVRIGFLWSAFKYQWRAGAKGPAAEDLDKAKHCEEMAAALQDHSIGVPPPDESVPSSIPVTDGLTEYWKLVVQELKTIDGKQWAHWADSVKPWHVELYYNLEVSYQNCAEGLQKYCFDRRKYL